MPMALLTVIRDGAKGNVAASHPLARISPIKDGTQKTTFLAKLQAVILTLDAPAKEWYYLYIYCKLMGIALKWSLSG